MKRLRDDALYTTALSGNSQTKLFPAIRQKILSFLNSFLVSVESESMGCRVKFNFSKTAVPGQLDGIFRNNELVGMLEANDYSCIEMISAHLGALIDRS